MKFGDGTEAGVTQGPLTTWMAIDKVEKHIADAIQGRRQDHYPAASAMRSRQLLRADGACERQVRRVGRARGDLCPLAPVFRFKDEAEVIAMCNNSPSAWRSYFFRATSAESGGLRSAGVRHGRRSTPASSPPKIAPFAASGEWLGREGSHHGMEEYVEIKYVIWRGV